MKSLQTILLAGIMVVGCGSPSGKQSDNSASNSAMNSAPSLATSENVDAIIAELGVCDISKQTQVCYSNNTSNYYYCVDGRWSQVQIFQTTATKTVGAEGGCIGTPIQLNSSNTAAKANDSSENTWVSPTTGTVWVFGNTIKPSELNTNNAANVFTTNFLCPAGTVSPTQAQYEAEFSSAFLNWIGNQWLIVGIVNESYKDSYYVIGADAQGNFDLFNALQIADSITAVCVKQ